MDKRDLLEGQKRPTTGARRGTRYRQHRSGQYLALRPDAAEEERVEEVHAHAILRHQFACVIHAGRWSARRPPAHAPAPSTPRPLSSIPVPSKAWSGAQWLLQSRGGRGFGDCLAGPQCTGLTPFLCVLTDAHSLACSSIRTSRTALPRSCSGARGISVLSAPPLLSLASELQ